MAQTLDGHVAHPTQAWNFGSAEDRRRMDRLREWADALIVSRKTLEHDNMNLTVRTKPAGLQHPRPVIVMQRAVPFARNLNVLKAAGLGGEIWIDTHGEKATLKELWPDLNADWQKYSFTNVTEIVASLASRGFKKILLEGGPTLNGIFFQNNLVDEFHLTLLPILWGGATTDRSVMTGAPLPLTQFTLRRAEKRGNEMFFRYVRKKL